MSKAGEGLLHALVLKQDPVSARIVAIYIYNYILDTVPVGLAVYKVDYSPASP